MSKFGERLKELRLGKGLSKVELSKKIGNKVANSAIAMWETNKRISHLEVSLFGLNFLVLV